MTKLEQKIEVYKVLSRLCEEEMKKDMWSDLQLIRIKQKKDDYDKFVSELEELKADEEEELICQYCGKYKKLPSNGVIYQLCEC